MKHKEYTLRLTAKEFLYIFQAVFGDTDQARRRYSDVREDVESCILDAQYSPLRDSGLGECTCEDAVVSPAAVREEQGA